MRELQSEADKHHLIAGYPDLVVWSRKAGLLTDHDAGYLIRESTRRPAETAAVFHHAIAFRETIYRFFEAIAHGRVPQAADLALLNLARSDALAHSRIHRASARPVDYALDWDNATALDRMLWPIALSAAELLTEMDMSRVRQCSGCDWLFLDTSRNHLRRWCSMSACGNRAKVRRFNERKRRFDLKRR